MPLSAHILIRRSIRTTRLDSGNDPPPAADIFEAVRDQVGLRLECRGNMPVKLLTVDRASQVLEQ
jgi:uncharacterized protein (TIGR03435 family)